MARPASAARATKASLAYVKQITDSIGYVEYAYAVQNKIAYTLMKTPGQVHLAERQVIRCRAATADWAHARDFNLVMTNAPGPNAYPITASTLVLMYKQPKNRRRAQSAASSSTGH